MFRNYLTIAIRNLWRNKTFSLINIVGLALGIAFALLIGVFIWGEFQVNAKLKDRERLHIVLSEWNPKEMGWEVAVPPIAFKLLYENYPHLVESYCRLGESSVNASKNENRFYEYVMMADSSMLTMFGFKLLHGNPQTAFQDPYSAVITKKTALKYFGRTDVVNEIIILETEPEGKKPHKVTGVLDDAARNSVMEFAELEYVPGIYLSLKHAKKYVGWVNNLDDWGMTGGFIGYIKLREGVSKAEVENALNTVIKKYAPAEFQGKLTYKVEQLNEFHFNKMEGVLYRLLITISIVTGLIILLAMVNFVNIFIGNSANRLKEIGLRKTFGGNRGQLTRQFLTEALLITCVSAIFAFLIYELAKHVFEQIFERTFPSIYQFSPSFLTLSIAIIFILGVLSGFYPAFILASFQIAVSVKGKIFFAEGKGYGRKFLIVFQMALAVATITIALFVSKQIQFIFSKDVGYSTKNILKVKGFTRNNDLNYLERLIEYRKIFEKIPGVESVSLTSYTPVNDIIGTDNFRLSTHGPEQGYSIKRVIVDENYFKTYGIETLKGVAFFPDNGFFEANSLVINESAAKLLGISDLSKAKLKLKWNDNIYPVKGIVKDFHSNSFHEKLAPMVFVHIRQYNYYRNFCFKLGPQNKTQTIAAIKVQYEKFFPDAPYDARPIEEEYKSIYKEDLKIQKAVLIAVVLALVIVVIGIVGLVSIQIAKRRKEIGIRKILGDDVVGIVQLFIKDFMVLLILANVLAWVMAYFFIAQWLESFVYKIDLTKNAWIFILASAFSFLITVVTISIQTIKTAIENPVNSLKDE
jgi:putative ABC transport system permease protein